MRAWVILAALTGSTFLYVTTETLPIGLLPQIAAGVGTSPSAVGLLVTAYGLMVVVVTIPLTRLTHRWRRRRLLATLLLIATAATAVSALAPSYPVLLGGRVAVALSQAVFWAVVTPATAALFRPEVRGRAIAILYAGASAGPLLGVPGGTWLGQHAGWRVPFFVLAALSFAASFVILALMPDHAAGASDADRGTAPDAGRYRVLIVAVAVTVTGGFAAFTAVTPFLTDVAGMSDAAVGPVLLVRGIAGLSGAILAGFLVRRHAWRTMAALVALQAVALAVQYLWGTRPATAATAIAVAGLALSGLTTVLAARVLEVAPGDTDLASAGMSTAFNVGITAGALLGSYLLTVPAIRASAAFAALITAAGLAVVLAEPRLASRRPSRTRPGMGDHSAEDGCSGGGRPAGDALTDQRRPPMRAQGRGAGRVSVQHRADASPHSA
jgi:MFS transporter, DHA1 family, inner membrane transport protein